MRTVAFLALALSACVPDYPLNKLNWADDLVQTGGCADMELYAVDEADSAMLLFQAPGVVAQTLELGTTQAFDWDLPAEGATLELTEGDRVSDATCDDVIENDGPQVRRTWQAVAGQASLTVVPIQDGEAWEVEADATLLLLDVILEDEEGAQVGLPSFTFTSTRVGWLPG